MTELVLIVLSAVLANNFVLVKFLGLCPFFGASARIETALGMSLATTFVLTVAAGTGALVAHHSLLRFPGGVQNSGSLAFSGGFNDVLGEITNLPGGLITVSGGATVVFNEDVANGGTITVSASGALASTAIFLGELSGNGIAGSGTVFIEGDMRPGFSPGTMRFGGDLGYGPLATLHLEIGAPDQYDRIEVAGNLDALERERCRELHVCENVGETENFSRCAAALLRRRDGRSASKFPPRFTPE